MLRLFIAFALLITGVWIWCLIRIGWYVCYHYPAVPVVIVAVILIPPVIEALVSPVQPSRNHIRGEMFR